MSVNSTYTFDDDLQYYCSKVCTYMSTVITALRVTLLLPLSAFVLHLGYQRWRQQRSFKTASHSDLFTYHTAAMEMIWVLGCLLNICGIYSNHSALAIVGFYTTNIGLYGEMFFHILTCVERYLAVVHPITYLSLRNTRGVRIRNISIICVWLLSFGLISVTAVLLPNNTTIPLFCFLAFSVIAISFCSISVLCVLIHPGPGKGDRGKELVDQSKQRAFSTITVISGTLWLWFIGLLVSSALAKSSLLTNDIKCVVSTSAAWFNLPSSFALPLLYLHRAGKLSCCRCH